MTNDIYDELAMLRLTVMRLEAEVAALRTSTPVQPAPARSVDQALIDQIREAPMEKLPSLITRQKQNDDGSPVIGPDGRVVLLNQDGSELTEVQKAIVLRTEELRSASRG